jgi:hypothetical protein
MGAFSPVIHADSKFYGYGRNLCVDVLFRDRSELDRLIEALTALRDSAGDEADHVHLQDGGHGRDGRPAEVTFHRPGPDPWDSDEIVADAKAWLDQAGDYTPHDRDRL